MVAGLLATWCKMQLTLVTRDSPTLYKLTFIHTADVADKLLGFENCGLICTPKAWASIQLCMHLSKSI